jgi:hypothetical protein
MIPCLDPVNDPELWYSGHARDVQKAQALCSDCSMRNECLSLAIKAEHDTPLALRFGIFGGMTPEDRMRATVSF